MNNRQKKMLLRIAASGALFAAGGLAQPTGTTRLVLYLAAYLLIGWDVLWRAVRNLAGGQVFDENFLMELATVGAFAIGEFPEGVAVMLFYQIGEWFQSYAVGRSRKSIAALMDIRPDIANVERDGKLEEADPEDVQVDDIIVIRAGERVPLDGVILEGTSSLDTSALTGESLPRTAGVGDEVISGCINQTGLLRVRVSKPFEQSTVARILDLVENSSAKKAKAENFISKFARYYTPCVVAAALALFVIPSLLLGGWSQWLHRALIFLVISCPCALVISVPLSFFGGIGGASKQGILVKGGNYLEALAKADTVVFDKTGTLTRGVFRVTGIYPQSCTEQQLLELAALAESYSNHPISRSLREGVETPLDTGRVGQVEELSGRGVRAQVDGRTVLAGNSLLMHESGIPIAAEPPTGTVVHVAREGSYLGCILISDEPKPDAADAIRALKRRGVRRTVMLTGDAQAVAQQVAKQLGLDEVHAQLLPADKVERVEQLLRQKAPGGQLLFVGDGINDAPVLSRSDVGIAMGAMGSDAAIEAADVVLMDDQPSKIAQAITIARRTLRIVHQNIVFALGVKALVLLLGAFGAANMWEAVFADVGVSVIAICNAMRALQVDSHS